MNATPFRFLKPLAAVVLALAAFFSINVAAKAKTLVYCIAEDPETFRPAASIKPASFEVTHQIYDRLASMEASGARAVPNLAGHWDLSEGGKVYTFHLRRGVKWHGTPFFHPSRDLNADDVIFTLERLTKPDHPYYKAPVPGGFDNVVFSRLVEKAEKTDDYTVRVTLSAPSGPFLATMASDYLGIQSKEYADQLLKAGTPEKLDLEPVGTGPFALAEYRKGEGVRFVAFPLYWARPPAINNLIFMVEPDASARWQKVQKGDCHIMSQPNPADIEAIKNNEDVQLTEWVGANVQYLAFNTEKKPFGNVRVRRAFGLAIDKDAIVKAVYGERAMIATTAIPPTMWSFNKAIKNDPHYTNPAKKLLDEAGQKGGFSAELLITPSWRPGAAAAQKIAEMVHKDLAEIGVKVEIKSVDAAEFYKRINNGEHQIALIGLTSINADPDSILRAPLNCERDKPVPGNTARWCDSDYQRLTANARKNSYYGERRTLYEQAQEIMRRKMPWLPISHMLSKDVVRKEVEGYKPSMFISHNFARYRLKPQK